jgi:RsiW-degrading membrane proteinase PrsW (M82 family)
MGITNLAIIFFFAFIPAMGWLVLYYLKDDLDPEPKKVVSMAFLFGALAALPFLALRYLMPILAGNSWVFQGFSLLVIFSLMEEMAKLAAAIHAVRTRPKVFNQIIDGVVYAVSAALGFAFVENMIYFWSFVQYGASDNLLYVTVFRSFGTMLAHTLFSATAGLISAYAYFSKQISPFHQKHIMAFEVEDFLNREILTLHILRQNVLKGQASRRGGHEKKILVLEGILLATGFHIAFNLTTTFNVFGKSLTFLLVPALMGGFLYVSYLFTKRFNQKILKIV